MRDDFNAATRKVLADRVAYRCSNPDCRASTAGPQTRLDKALNVGVAAHITAASTGGPRFNPALSESERSDISNGIWLCQTCAKLIDNDIERYTESLLRDWKRSAERDALAAIGKTDKAPSKGAAGAAEREIKRNLALRDKMHKAFLKPFSARQPMNWRAKPHSKFAHSKVLVRSLEDTRYPEVDDAPEGRMSSWLTFEVYDFYHNGLVVIVHLDKGIMDKDGNWAIVPYTHCDDPIDSEKYGEIKVWVLGRIPWRNIREVDMHGDEYYNMPHLYCAFADDGMPYEDFVYAICSDSNDYDWPLDSAKRFKYPEG